MHVLQPTLLVRQLQGYNALISCICMALVNGVYGYALATKTPKILMSYRKVLVFHMCVDVVFSIYFAIFKPSSITTKLNEDVVQIRIIESVVIESLPAVPTAVLFSIYMFFFNWQITFVSIHFMYRYFMLAHPQWTSFKGLSVLIFLSSLVPIGYSAYLLYVELQTRPLYWRLEFLLRDTEWVEDDGTIPRFSAMFIRDHKLTFAIPAMAVVCYIIVFICAHLINKKLVSFTSMVEHRQNYQIKSILAAQAVIPLCTTVAIQIIVQTSRLFAASPPAFVNVFNFLLPWTPVCHPITVMLIITPYRKFVFPCIYRRLLGNKVSESSSKQQQQQQQRNKLSAQKSSRVI